MLRTTEPEVPIFSVLISIVVLVILVVNVKRYAFLITFNALRTHIGALMLEAARSDTRAPETPSNNHVPLLPRQTMLQPLAFRRRRIIFRICRLEQFFLLSEKLVLAQAACLHLVLFPLPCLLNLSIVFQN